jgi:hypothetical protein
MELAADVCPALNCVGGAAWFGRGAAEVGAVATVLDRAAFGAGDVAVPDAIAPGVAGMGCSETLELLGAHGSTTAAQAAGTEYVTAGGQA